MLETSLSFHRKQYIVYPFKSTVRSFRWTKTIIEPQRKWEDLNSQILLYGVTGEGKNRKKRRQKIEAAHSSRNLHSASSMFSG